MPSSIDRSRSRSCASSPRWALPRSLAERLVRESRMMAKIVDPAVITVHDVGRDGDSLFIAMELVRGHDTWRVHLRRPRAARGKYAPSWREIVALYERAGRGLAAAHAVGVIHRDFKPDNVLVELAGDAVSSAWSSPTSASRASRARRTRRRRRVG